MTSNGDPLADFFVNATEQKLFSTSYGYELGGTRTTGVRHSIELLAFWVADEEYCLSIAEIQEIIKVPPITEVPRTDASVLGITSLRGTIVPVLAAHALLDLPAMPRNRNTRILVLRGDGDPVGLLVDSISNVVRLAEGAIEAKPSTLGHVSRDLVTGVGRIGNRMLITLDVASLLRSL